MCLHTQTTLDNMMPFSEVVNTLMDIHLMSHGLCYYIDTLGFCRTIHRVTLCTVPSIRCLRLGTRKIMLLDQPFLQPGHQRVCHLHILKICARHHNLNKSAQSQICALQLGVHTVCCLVKTKPVYSCN